MKNQDRFNKAIDALYQSYFNNTLTKGSCYACAVGQIVAAAQGGTITIDENYKAGCTTYNAFWNTLFITADGIQEQMQHSANEVILNELTGYTADELARVEYAFETNTALHWHSYRHSSEQEILEDQYKGLVAVFEVLLKLEEMADEGYTEKLKTHPKLQLV